MSAQLPSYPISEFTYNLPEQRIALYPAQPKDHSRLLVYRKGNISHTHFYKLPSELPEDILLVLNDTRVIPARLVFATETEKKIEIFLLQPLTNDWSQWECMVGNRKHFKEGATLALASDDGSVELQVEWRNRDKNQVYLKQTGAVSVAEVIARFGKVPLPPYIKRDVNEDDPENYQTRFAKSPGAVAAPTASLHFTEDVLQQLDERGVKKGFVTLHVGLGTFKPMTAERTDAHEMHAEVFRVDSQFLQLLIDNLDKTIIPSGTTAMRVLESLYYVGAALLLGRPEPWRVAQNAGFDADLNRFTHLDALQAALRYSDTQGGAINGTTSIFIVPGFVFRFSKGLITNFHQPGSTLLLLVAAFIGTDWRQVYGEAMERDYRFLSYGDASLLLP